MAFMPLDLDMFLAEMKHDVAEIVYDDYGTVRVFRGTLMGRLLPAPPVTPQGLEEHILIQRTRQDKKMVLWDVAARNWREFPTDRIIMVQITPSY